MTIARIQQSLGEKTGVEDLGIRFSRNKLEIGALSALFHQMQDLLLSLSFRRLTGDRQILIQKQLPRQLHLLPLLDSKSSLLILEGASDLSLGHLWLEMILSHVLRHQRS
jgi:hypothetical protein